MPDTLTQLIAKVQAQLLDNGTLFTTPTITAAMRQALADLNKAVPQNAAITVAGIADQLEYEVTDQDPAATGVLDVLLQGSNDLDTSLPFYAYNEDSRVFFRLRSSLTAAQTMVVRYILPHTIFGLDAATDSTLPDPLNVAILNGACYYSCLIRSIATIETNNVQPAVARSWADAASIWKLVFDTSLAIARRQPTPRGEPRTQAWNDSWHDPRISGDDETYP